MRLLLVIFSVILASAISIRYERYKLYEVFAETEAQNKFLLTLQRDTKYDFWSDVNKIGRPVDIMVSPEEQNKFENYMKTCNIKFNVKVDDVERLIQEERTFLQLKKASKDPTGRISFDQFYTIDEINEYLNQLADDYPGLVNVTSIGKSYENRSMNAIIISSGPSTPPKPIIFVDGGIHAREWIAPAVTLYLINQLVENPDNSDLFEKVDWIIAPVVNPDGYALTWTNDNRMWRKTTSPGFLCPGTDANRNFDYHWLENDGASPFECAEDYAGSEPFSEIEARNIRDVLLNTKNIKAYLSFHSYAQSILYPYGYNGELPDNWQEIDDLGNRIRDAIFAVGGTRYDVGNSARLLYVNSGTSMDWALAVSGINISITIELPGRTGGFVLNPSDILPIVTETFEGIKVFHDHVGQGS